MNDMSRRVTAELFGTFWLTFAGCGARTGGQGRHRPAWCLASLWSGQVHGPRRRAISRAVTLIRALGLPAGWCQQARRLPLPGCGRDFAAGVLYVIASGKPGWPDGRTALAISAPVQPAVLRGVRVRSLCSHIIMGTTSVQPPALLPASRFTALTLIHLRRSRSPILVNPAQHWPGAVRRRRIHQPTLAILGGANVGGAGRPVQEVAARRGLIGREACKVHVPAGPGAAAMTAG